MSEFIIIFSLCFIGLVPYILWPNRWNIPTHMALAFSITAYIIPGFMTNAFESFNKNLIELYSYILLVGAFSFGIGCFFGSFQHRYNNFILKLFNINLIVYQYQRVIERRLIYFSVFGLIGIMISFYIMGFIPLFADDPFSAKFFRGQYRDRYLQVAPLYRISYFALALLVPFLIAVWMDTKKNIYVYIGLIITLVLFLSLARAPAAAGVLTCLSIIFAIRRKLFLPFLFLLVVIYAFGSSTFIIFKSFVSQSSIDLNIFKLIALGAPDINDQLSFLKVFLQKEPFTYGKTIFGGLVPGNFQWNPSVWTLSIISDTNDISDISSGGLRLPVPLWGFLNFGWIGVVLFSLFSGYLTARAINYLKFNIISHKLLRPVVVLAIYSYVWGFVVNFYRLSFYSVLQIFILYILLRTVKYGKKKFYN